MGKRISVKLATHELDRHLQDMGYSDGTLENYRSVWRQFSRFASKRKRRWFSVRLADEYRSFAKIPRYGEVRRRGRVHMARTAMRLLCDFAKTGSCRKYGMPPSTRMLSKRHRTIVDEYLCYQKRRNMSPGTLSNHKRDAERFLVFVASSGFRLEQVGSQGMDSYLQQLGSMRRASLSGIMGRLRAFIRYLDKQGEVSAGLALTIPQVRLYSDARILPTWPRECIEHLLNSVDRSDAVGKRDYVILILAARYGIRSGDITNLRLDNIHWRSEEIAFVQQKTGNALQLPLTVDVGDAIIDYLRNARPASTCRHLLLTCVTPVTPLGPKGICSVVVRQLRRAGIELPDGCRANLRSLRYSVATNLLHADTPLATIASVLGHADLESTHCYLKLDIESLRTVCLDPEGF